MRRGTFKSIISLSLVIFLLIPNISTVAVELSGVLQADVEKSKANVQGEIVASDKIAMESSENKDDVIVKPENEIDNLGGQTVKENNLDEIIPKSDINQEINSVKDEVQNAASNGEAEDVKKSQSGETYEFTKKQQAYSFQARLINREEYQPEEVIGRKEAISELEYLVPKTSSNFEIAMSHSDGSYSYVESVDNIEKAIEIVQSMTLLSNGEAILPAVVNNEGQVVYSTNSMLRILSKDNSTINIYTESSLTNAFTYINQDYVDDAPIIEDNGSAVKIEISGFTGWIDKNTSSEVVPMNQVINPSYYISKGGVLYHFISYDLRSSINKGYELVLGPAPSYLKEGVKYFSYDGNYFYEGSDISTGLNRVISDLKNGNHNNSINSVNPHYLYFNYLPFRSATSYTASELDKFINNNTEASSKLRGIGQALIDAQNNYGANALLTLGVAINESGWGQSPISQAKNNLFGIKAYDSSPGTSADSFNTPGDSVIEFAKNYISRGYADPADWRYNGGFLGNKNKGANIKYASDPFWGEKASQFAYKIDFYLSSSNINNLTDHNAYQIAMYKSDNQVKNSSGTLLYNVTSDLKQYAGYYDTPLVLTSTSIVYKNGIECYEMYSERNTPVNNGGTENKFDGKYNWSDKGYVRTSGIAFLNKPKNAVLPHDLSYISQWMKNNDGKWYYYDGNSNIYRGWLNLKGKYYFLEASTGEMKTGWLKDKNEWYYLDESGEMLTGLVTVEDDRYLLDGSGKMLTGWQIINGSWYYFESSGVMSRGWRQIGAGWYYLNESTGKMETDWLEIAGRWYYLNPSGERRTGWLQTKSGKYYLEISGVMSTGWKFMNGQWYYFNQNTGTMATGIIEVEGKSYYLDGNGVMGSNRWVNTLTGWYYLGADGASAIGWNQLGGTWYYFNSNGVMKTGWVSVDGEWYYLDASGAMQKGWIKTQSGQLYFLENSGNMAKGWKLIGNKWYYLNVESGAMAKGLIEVDGNKYFLENSGIMITDWKEVAGKWYFFQSNGAAIKSDWLKTSYSYYFNADSIMVTGWQNIKDKKYYLYSENGRMAQNVTIDGIFIGKDGVATR